MKKLITILLLMLTFNLSAQEINIVDSPAYYYLTVEGDTILPRYTKESKAILRGAVLAELNKGKQVEIKRPVGFFTILDIGDETPIDNGILRTITTSDETVTIEFPTDDTGYLYVINPEAKTIVANEKIYTNYKYLTFVQYETGWEFLN